MNTTLNIAKLLLVCKKIEGRKKIQKIVHILQCAGYGAEFPHQFGYLHYGPYSHDVKSDLDVLTGSRVASESATTVGMGHKSFVYEPSSELLQALKPSSPLPWEGLAKALNEKSPQELEAISTILFLKKTGVQGLLLQKRFESLKPALIDRYSSASDYVNTLSIQK